MRWKKWPLPGKTRRQSSHLGVSGLLASRRLLACPGFGGRTSAGQRGAHAPPLRGEAPDSRWVIWASARGHVWDSGGTHAPLQYSGGPRGQRQLGPRVSGWPGPASEIASKGALASEPARLSSESTVSGTATAAAAVGAQAAHGSLSRSGHLAEGPCVGLRPLLPVAAGLGTPGRVSRSLTLAGRF